MYMFPIVNVITQNIRSVSVYVYLSCYLNIKFRIPHTCISQVLSGRFRFSAGIFYYGVYYNVTSKYSYYNTNNINIVNCIASFLLCNVLSQI